MKLLLMINYLKRELHIFLPDVHSLLVKKKKALMYMFCLFGRCGSNVQGQSNCLDGRVGSKPSKKPVWHPSFVVKQSAAFQSFVLAHTSEMSTICERFSTSLHSGSALGIFPQGIFPLATVTPFLLWELRRLVLIFLFPSFYLCKSADTSVNVI